MVLWQQLNAGKKHDFQRDIFLVKKPLLSALMRPICEMLQAEPSMTPMRSYVFS